MRNKHLLLVMFQAGFVFFSSKSGYAVTESWSQDVSEGESGTLK